MFLRVAVERAVRGQRLAIGFTTMADSNDVHYALAICYAVHDTPLPCANAPQICCAFQLYDASWACGRWARYAGGLLAFHVLLCGGPAQ